MKALLFILSFISFSLGAQNIITTIAGTTQMGFSGDGGPATQAMLHAPTGMAIDKKGNIYFSDFTNNRVRKIDTSGIITTFAGKGIAGFSGDSGRADSAKLYDPWGLAFDKNGNLYIADAMNNRIRRVDTAGIITTVAGNGICGFAGDGNYATLAQICYPLGVVVDKTGKLYLSDASQHIRMVVPTGQIFSIAGNGTSGYGGDGGSATLAMLRNPSGLEVDTIGNLYIADGGNQRIRKVDANGKISTIAGTGTAGYNGDGAAATVTELFYPNCIVLDKQGNFFITDGNNERIRKIDAAGIVTTVAGTGTFGFSGDGGPATSAKLYTPIGIGVNSAGDLFFCDEDNSRIRKIAGVAGIKTTWVKEDYAVFPNPTSRFITIAYPVNTAQVIVTNVLGEKIINEPCGGTGRKEIDLTDHEPGVYFITVRTTDRCFTKKIIKE